MIILSVVGVAALCGLVALGVLLWICARCKAGKPKPHQLLDPLYLVPFLLLVLPCRAAAPPNKPIYVTNYIYSYFNQTNWIYNNTVTTQTNYVFTTNNIHTTNTVFNFLTVTNQLSVTNYVFVTNTAPPVDLRPWYFLTNQPLVLTNLRVVGTLTMSNSTPGLVQTQSGTNITGHVP